MPKLYGWFSEKAKKACQDLKPKPPDIFYTNTTGGIVEVTIVTKTPTLNKKNFRWDDVVYMASLFHKFDANPLLQSPWGAVNDT